MRVDNFSLFVTNGDERESGHVHMRDGTDYRIRLVSHSHQPCDAEVVVDGKPVGAFRLEAYGNVTLERPEHDTGKFTFFAADSAEGQAAGADGVHREEKGVISVLFKPGISPTYRSSEHPMYPTGRPLRRAGGAGGSSARGMSYGGAGGQSMGSTPQWAEPSITMCSMSPDSAPITSDSFKSIEAGVTGLTGHSDQRFTTVRNLNYLPESQWVRINLRLVVDRTQSAVSRVRPLTPSRSNAVPAPI